MSHEAAVVEMGVRYRPVKVTDIRVRPTAADSEELDKLAEWAKKFGTLASNVNPVNVNVHGSAGCLALCGQPAVIILVGFILFWVIVMTVYY